MPKLLLLSLVLLFALSACGLNMSGEPDIVSEQEIKAAPTELPPTAADTAGPAAAALSGTQEAADVVTADAMQIYLEKCAACHGAEDGAGPALAGMGERAAARVEGQSAEAYLRESIVDPAAYIVDGYQDTMPHTFGDELTANQIDSLVKFIIEFTPQSMFAAQPTPAESQPGTPAATQVAEVPAETLSLNGKLIQGTQNGNVIPPDLPLELYALDPHGALIDVYTTTSNADGIFRFENVASGTGNVYFVRADYAGITQGAQIPAIQGDEQELSVDVTLYDMTTDTSTIAVSHAQVLVNYAPINEFGLEVRLDLELINTGDRIVASDKVAQRGWPISVAVELPVGAFGIQPMQTEGSERYQVELVDGVPLVQDTWPLRPEQVHTITVLYYLPYESGAVLEHAFGYPVMDAAVLLPNDTVSFESEQFNAEGQFRYRVMGGGLRVRELKPDEEISPDSDSTLIKAYKLLKPLEADNRLVFSLEGRPTRTVNVMPPTVQNDTPDTNALPYVLAGIGLASLALAGVLWWRQRGAAVVPPTSTWQPPKGKEALLRTLAELDNAHDAGLIDDETYQERREILKERLIPLMDEDE